MFKKQKVIKFTARNLAEIILISFMVLFAVTSDFQALFLFLGFFALGRLVRALRSPEEPKETYYKK